MYAVGVGVCVVASVVVVAGVCGFVVLGDVGIVRVLLLVVILLLIVVPSLLSLLLL